MANRRLAVLGAGLVAAGIILMTFGAAFGSGPGSSLGQAAPWAFGPDGMMGFGAANAGTAPDPGAPGFIAGTTSAPRPVRIVAGAAFRFYPDVVTLKHGETITFVVTSTGPLVHEFMVGPADAVAADQAGTPEITDIGMMTTKALTYTFDGPGPYVFASHAPGHYEAGMRGVIVVVP